MKEKISFFLENKPAFLLFFILSIALSLIAISWVPYHNHEEHRISAETERLIEAQLSRAQMQLEVYIQALYGYRGFATAHREMDAKHWQEYFKGIDATKRLPGLTSVGLAYFISDSEKNTFLQRVRNDRTVNPNGFPDFSIQPEGSHDDYLILTYIEPSDLTSLRRSYGFDLSTSEPRKIAYLKARDTSEPVITEPVTGRSSQQSSLLLMLAIYDTSLPTKTFDERRTAFRGIVVEGFRTQDFFDLLFKDMIAAYPEMAIEVYDGPEVREDRLMYDSTHSKEVLGSASDEQTTSLVRTISAADRMWTFRFIYDLPEPSRFIIPTLVGRISFLVLTNVITVATIWYLLIRKKIDHS